MIAKVYRVQTNNREVNQLQQNIIASVNGLVDVPINQGNLVQSVALKAANTVFINHGLGRNLIGWFPVRVRAQATIWDAQDSNANASLTLALKTSADVTADIFCF